MRGKSVLVFQETLDWRIFTNWDGLSLIVFVLGFGIRPRGPNIFATLASLGIMSGEATRMSKSIFGETIRRLISSSLAVAMVICFQVPWGRATVPRRPLSETFKWSSTEPSKWL